MRVMHLPSGISVDGNADRFRNRLLVKLMALLKSKIYWLNENKSLDNDVRIYTEKDFTEVTGLDTCRSMIDLNRFLKINQ